MKSFRLLALPIGLKLLIGIVVAFALLLIPLLLLVRAGIDEVGEVNGRAFAAENGARQASAVSNFIENARANIDNFVQDISVERALTSALLGGISSDIDLSLSTVSPGAVETLFNEVLLNTATTPYENVRLLNSEGRVIARTTIAGPSTDVADDESESPIFRAAVGAQLQGETRTLSIAFRNIPIIDYSHAIIWRDGSTLGYLVVRLSNSRAIYTQLRFNDPSYPAYTFLSTLENDIIAPSLAVAQEAQKYNPSIVARAALGQSGTDTYRLEDGTEVIGYYTPVRGTPLVLMTQVAANEAILRAQDFFTVRLFVVGLGLAALIIVFALVFNQILTPPLRRLRRATLQLSDGDFNAEISDAGRGDEIGSLAASLVTMRDSVRANIDDLEARLAARTRDMSATQDISRFAATQRDLPTLMTRVVDLIVERFPTIYHAQIFLTDAEGKDAIVRASTGTVGEKLIGRGHRLAVGSASVIGQVTDTGRTVHARDTAVSGVHLPNEFLPQTRAELAIPLRIGESVIGALDVQSKEREAFSDDLINVLSTMADQIAVAIQNARLYEDSLRRASDLERANRQTTLRAWQDYMREGRRGAILKTAGITSKKDKNTSRTLEEAAGTGTLTANDDDMSDLRRAALIAGQPMVGARTERDTIPVAVPIQLRGQTLGVVEWELPARNFGDDQMELAQELSNRLAISLENARLFQESKRATERERLVNTIAAKLTAQSRIEDILQTAVREVGQALGAPQVSIRLRTINAPPAGVIPPVALLDKPNGHHANGDSPTNAQSSPKSESPLKAVLLQAETDTDSSSRPES